MRVIGKTSLNDIEIKSKIEKGIKTFELHLGSNFLDTDKTIEYIKKYDIDITSIHSFILDNGRYFPLHYVCHPIYRQMLKILLKDCQKIAEYEKHDIKVIIHQELGLDEWENIKSMTTEIIDFLREILTDNKNIIISLENISPVDKNNIMRSGFKMHDLCQIVKNLREILNTDRIGITFDTTHYEISKKFTNIINNIYYFSEYSLMPITEKYFGFLENEENAKLINNIHLAKCLGLGVISGEHGVCLNEKDKPWIYDIIFLLKKYNCNPDICLEVNENDYKNPVDLEKSYKIIMSVIEETN